MSKSDNDDGTCDTQRLTAWERCKVAAIGFAFWAIFTFVFGMILAFGEPFDDLRNAPLDPEGWFIVRTSTGTVVREATVLDMIVAKYSVLLLLAGYAFVFLFSGYVFLLAVTGRRNRLTRWVLKELSSDKSFRLTE